MERMGRRSFGPELTYTQAHLELKRIPAFGFENSKAYAGAAEARIAKKDFDNTVRVALKTHLLQTRMAGTTPFNEDEIKELVIGRLTGNFEATRDAAEEVLQKRIRKRANVRKIIAYIPVLGTFAGMSRLISQAMDKEKNLSKLNYLRGVIETLSLGILLLPVDLIVTGYRNRKWKKMGV